MYCDENLLAFKRVLNDEKLIVIFNNSDEDAIIELNLKCSAKELITGNIQELKKINLDKRSLKFLNTKSKLMTLISFGVEL